jgi:hypothetical protein
MSKGAKAKKSTAASKASGKGAAATIPANKDIQEGNEKMLPYYRSIAQSVVKEKLKEWIQSCPDAAPDQTKVLEKFELGPDQSSNQGGDGEAAMFLQKLGLKDEHVTCLIKLLSHTPTIAKLDLSENDLTTGSVEALSALVEGQLAKVRELHQDERLRAVFLHEVVLLGNKGCNFEGDSLTELTALCDCMKHVNTSANIRQLFAGSGALDSVDESLLRAMWTGILPEVSEERLQEALSGSEISNKPGERSLTFPQAQRVILEDCVERGLLPKLTEWQMLQIAQGGRETRAPTSSASSEIRGEQENGSGSLTGQVIDAAPSAATVSEVPESRNAANSNDNGSGDVTSAVGDDSSAGRSTNVVTTEVGEALNPAGVAASELRRIVMEYETEASESEQTSNALQRAVEELECANAELGQKEEGLLAIIGNATEHAKSIRAGETGMHRDMRSLEVGLKQIDALQHEFAAAAEEKRKHQLAVEMEIVGVVETFMDATQLREREAIAIEKEEGLLKEALGQLVGVGFESLVRSREEEGPLGIAPLPSPLPADISHLLPS